jgi:hypothetical protein
LYDFLIKIKITELIKFRREILSEYFGDQHGLGLTSLATPLILGVRDHMHVEDPELSAEIASLKTTGDYQQRNIHSRSEFAIDGT